MEHDDDEQLAPLFVSQKIEELLKDKLKKDVEARHYEEFQKQLEVDLVDMVMNGSIEQAEKYIKDQIGRFAAGGAAQNNSKSPAKGSPVRSNKQQEEEMDGE